MVGKTISHYRILDKLGQGGMGVVYRAEDTRLGRAVALKLLPEDLATDTQALQRFQREARAASAINHPNICTLYDVGEESGHHFITMELLEGHTLQALLRLRPLPMDRVVELATAVADALAAAHAKDVVHRDIKPSNVFVTSGGQPKVLDFGVAKLAPGARSKAGARETAPYGTTETDLTGTGVAVGTMAYMSPEQLEGKEIDFRSDIFSFGVLLYEMASRAHPFSGSSAATTIANILTSEPAPLANLSPVAPAELDRIVRKCLRKKADQRYQSTADLAVDLGALHREATHNSSAAGRTLDESESDDLFVKWGSWIPSPRRWWELNLLFAIAVYLILPYAAWNVRKNSLWPDDLAGPWFGAMLAAVAVGASLRLFLMQTAMAQRDELHRRVRKLALPLRLLTGVHAALVFLMIPQLPGDRFPVAKPACLAATAAILVYALLEPLIERGAFPHAFTPRPEAPGQHLGRIMAGTQFLLAILFALGAWRSSSIAGEVVQEWAASEFRQSGTPPAESFLLFALFLLFVLLAVVWIATSWQMWVGPVPMARTFRRWIVYFLVPDCLAVGFGFALIMRLGPGFEFRFAFLVMALLLALPVSQVLIASRLDAGPRPSTVELLLPWTAHDGEFPARPKRLAWTIAALQLVFIAPALTGFVTQSEYLEWALIASDAPRKSAFVILSMGTSAVAGIVIAITIVAAGEKALKNFASFFPLILLMDFPGAMPLLFITFESTNLVSTLLLLPVLAAVPFVQRRLALAALRPSP